MVKQRLHSRFGMQTRAEQHSPGCPRPHSEGRVHQNSASQGSRGARGPQGEGPRFPAAVTNAGMGVLAAGVSSGPETDAGTMDEGTRPPPGQLHSTGQVGVVETKPPERRPESSP